MGKLNLAFNRQVKVNIRKNSEVDKKDKTIEIIGGDSRCFCCDKPIPYYKLHTDKKGKTIKILIKEAYYCSTGKVLFCKECNSIENWCANNFLPMVKKSSCDHIYGDIKVCPLPF